MWGTDWRNDGQFASGLPASLFGASPKFVLLREVADGPTFPSTSDINLAAIDPKVAAHGCN